jgi:hypothetical protein
MGNALAPVRELGSSIERSAAQLSPALVGIVERLSFFLGLSLVPVILFFSDGPLTRVVLALSLFGMVVALPSEARHPLTFIAAFVLACSLLPFPFNWLGYAATGCLLYFALREKEQFSQALRDLTKPIRRPAVVVVTAFPDSLQHRLTLPFKHDVMLTEQEPIASHHRIAAYSSKFRPIVLKKIEKSHFGFLFVLCEDGALTVGGDDLDSGVDFDIGFSPLLSSNYPCIYYSKGGEIWEAQKNASSAKQWNKQPLSVKPYVAPQSPLFAFKQGKIAGVTKSWHIFYQGVNGNIQHLRSSLMDGFAWVSNWDERALKCRGPVIVKSYAKLGYFLAQWVFFVDMKGHVMVMQFSGTFGDWSTPKCLSEGVGVHQLPKDGTELAVRLSEADPVGVSWRTSDNCILSRTLENDRWIPSCVAANE